MARTRRDEAMSSGLMQLRLVERSYDGHGQSRGNGERKGHEERPEEAEAEEESYAAAA